MALFAVAVVVLWRLFLNAAIRRTVEIVGTEVVGARVDLASARFRLRTADLLLRGLQVSNPDAPMTNLVEVEEMVLDLNGRALLEKKAVIQTAAVRRVRFGTPRRTSGAIERPSPKTGLAARRAIDWANRIPVPELDLTSIAGTVVNLPAIDAESLRTPREARAIGTRADSMRTAWLAELRALDPQPAIDSARALAERLRTEDPRRIGPAGVAQHVARVGTLTRQLQQTRDRIQALQRSIAAGVDSTRGAVARLEQARAADYAFARSLVRIPSFAAPDISAALFGQMAKERLQPIIRWLNVAEEWTPPGLRPSRDRGPRRARMDGTTFRFPRTHEFPTFLVEHAEADLAIGGATVAAGAYVARLTGFTTEPGVYGRPMTVTARRASDVGPRELSIAGTLDHRGAAPRDSLDAHVGGVSFPDLSIRAARGARLAFGASTVDLGFARSGAEINGFWRVRAPGATWTRSADSVTAAGPAPRIGSEAWAEALVWRAMSGVRDVTIEARFRGLLTSPDLTLSTNVGAAVADAVRRELGAEIDRVERQVRGEVDRRVGAATAEARAKAAALETEVQQRAAAVQQQLDEARQQLEQRLREMQDRAGLRLPGGIRLPRP